MMLVLFLGISQAMAQKKTDRAQAKTDRLDEKVGLTDEQKVKITDLNKSFSEEMKAIRQDGKAELREEMHTMMKAHREKVSEVLTDEQKQKLKADREQKRALHKAMREEIKSYRTKNIKPVMNEKRSKFEKVLTVDEKKAITEARAEIEKLKGDLKQERSDKKNDGFKPDSEMRKAHMDQVRMIIDTHIRPIIDAHKTELDVIEKELEPKRKQWKDHMKSIRTRHMGEVPEGPHKRRGGHEHHVQGGHKHGKHNKMRSRPGKTDRDDNWKSKFILMNPGEEK